MTRLVLLDIICDMTRFMRVMSHMNDEQKRPIFSQKRPTFSQKSPTISFGSRNVKRVMSHMNYSQKRPVFSQKRPTFCQKSPKFYLTEWSPSSQVNRVISHMNDFDRMWVSFVKIKVSFVSHSYVT